MALASCGGKKADIKALVGDWDYQQNDTPYVNGDPGDFFTDVASVLVREDGTYVARWYYEDSDRNGVVKIEYEEYPYGTKAPMFVFYENGDTFWIACPCEHEDPEIYYIGQDGMERLVKNKGQG